MALLAAVFPADAPAQTNGPRITALGRTNGLFSLTWTNTGTNAVTVERRGSLTSGSWGAIASNNVSGAHTDTNPPAGAAFYRLRVVSPPPPPQPAPMVFIPAGSFSMGNQNISGDGFSAELPVHTVDVSAFYMDKFEVTKALWDEVANWATTNGYDINAASGSGKATNHPAYNVSWYQAVKWCNARSEREGLMPCYAVGGAVMRTGTNDTVDCNFSALGYRLPTDAEWEKAARGGLSGKRFPWGDTISHDEANYVVSSVDGMTNSYSYDVTPRPPGVVTSYFHPTYDDGVWPISSPVGSFAANGYGIHDMVGNMREWCWDRYSSSYYSASPASDPRGPASGPNRVTRGGDWLNAAISCRTSHRASITPTSGGTSLGFRCARSSVP